MTQEQHDILESVYGKLMKDKEIQRSLPAWWNAFPSALVLTSAERTELLALLDCEFDFNTVEEEEA